jgi:hypothetical protein
MPKFIAAIWLVKIQWFWGVHLVYRIDGCAILSSMNGSGETISELDRHSFLTYVLSFQNAEINKGQAVSALD